MAAWINHIELLGQTVKLIPLEKNHKEGLLKAASDGELWNLWFTSVPSSETIDAYIENALHQRSEGTAYPFTVINKSSGEIVGCTRFCKLDAQNRRLEIGYTWYAQKHQRTAVNTECKKRLLTYAFEKLSCIAVQFMTDWHNIPSRRAIERLGAKMDGTLRNHRINADGSYRDSVVYSITETEWPAVKKSLIYRLA